MTTCVRSCAALVAVALATFAACSTRAATTAAAGDWSPCQRLNHSYWDGRAPRAVFVHGAEHALRVLHSARAPSRAAAALLLALLRHAARYRRAQLEPAPDGCRLARAFPGNCEDLLDGYQKIAMMPAAQACDDRRLCAPLRPRLRRLPGSAPAAAALRLLVYLAPHAPAGCHDAAGAWSFYANYTALRTCGFLTLSDRNDPETANAVVYTLEEHGEVRSELRALSAAAALRLRFETRGRDAAPRGALRAALRGAASFLFVEHAVWAGAPRVRALQPPRATRLDDTADTVFLATVDVFEAVAKELLEFARFAPGPDDLREVLRREAEFSTSGIGKKFENSVTAIEEAACDWASANPVKFEAWLPSDERSVTLGYKILLCANDPYETIYKDIVTIDIEEFLPTFRTKLNITFLPSVVTIDCESEGELVDTLYKIPFNGSDWLQLVGVIAKGERGGSAAASRARHMETALVLYSQTDEEAGPAAGWRGVGLGARRLAAALRRLLRWRGWRRVAVLAAEGPASAALLRELRAAGELRLLERPLRDAGGALRALRDADARVVLVLADAAAAGAVLCAAAAAGMAGPRHAWLTLARAPAGCGAPHLALEPAWRGQPLPAAAGRAALRERLRARCGRLCPPDAAPLLDARLLLLSAAASFLAEQPYRRHDLHGHNTTSALWWSLRAPVAGVSHELAGAEPAPLVFVSAWSAGRRVAQAVWRVRRDGVRELSASGEWPAAAADGGAACLARRSAFGRCLDWALAALAAACAAALPALLLARRARRARAARRERLLLARLLARERRAAAALAAHLVDRSALELRHELGAGRFGRVRFAVLRAPGRPPLAVAVKALPEDAAPAEESEFLREACTLAALRHDHVVRVLGVCVVDGPPLLLMEFAFFGDLAGYLRERRYLVEQGRITDQDSDGDLEEIAHVAPEALTRLAREAASALSYLAQRRIVHRDVRAANCLIDAQRSLKLADFGMARETAAGAGAAEYACRRRGLFPVMCMAPESLDRGVFSAASDVWALGVLMLELITVGDRPYGTWPPMRVLRYVIDGGLPLLPTDCSPETRDVVTSCWRATPDERPSAAEVAAYLADHPRALAAALQRPAPDDRPAETCPDSGPRAPGAALQRPAPDDRPAETCPDSGPRAPGAALQRPAPDDRPAETCPDSGPRAPGAALQRPAPDDRPAETCPDSGPRAPGAALQRPAPDDRPAETCPDSGPRAPGAALQRPAPDDRPADLSERSASVGESPKQ